MAAKILIIDDQPEVGRAISRALHGYETSTETDPRRAVRRVANGERFDIVLCDLVMPEMSGRDVYELVQCESDPPPMLIMSGGGNVTSLFASGCPVLIKPFTDNELRTLVSAILHEDDHTTPSTSRAP